MPRGVWSRLHWSWPILVLLLAPAEAPPAPRYGLPRPLARPPQTIRLATYNVQNLFDHHDDPALRGDWDDADLGVSPARARALAATIRAVDADVIALQEVESLAALTWFRDTYLPDAGYDWLASIDGGYYRGVECSVMSRLRITDARVWPDARIDRIDRSGPGWAPLPPERPETLRFQRSPLKVDLRTDEGYELTLLVVHHKSGRDFQWQREAEAVATVALVEQVRGADPSRNVAVVGDFNAAPWDKSLRVYLAAGLIDVMAHRSTRGEEGARYKTHASNRVLDYVLLNSAACRELVVGSAHVFGTPTSGRGQGRPAGYASDHFPVVVDLTPRDRV